MQIQRVKSPEPLPTYRLVDEKTFPTSGIERYIRRSITTESGEIIALFTSQNYQGVGRSALYYYSEEIRTVNEVVMSDSVGYYYMDQLENRDFIYTVMNTQISFFYINGGSFDLDRTVIFSSGTGFSKVMSFGDNQHLLRGIQGPQLQILPQTMTLSNQAPLATITPNFHSPVAIESENPQYEEFSVLKNGYVAITYEAYFPFQQQEEMFNICVYKYLPELQTDAVNCKNQISENEFRLSEVQEDNLLVMAFTDQKRIVFWDYVLNKEKYSTLYKGNFISNFKASKLSDDSFFLLDFNSGASAFFLVQFSWTVNKESPVKATSEITNTNGFQYTFTNDYKNLVIFTQDVVTREARVIKKAIMTDCPSGCLACDETTKSCYSCETEFFISFDGAKGVCQKGCEAKFFDLITACVSNCPQGWGINENSICKPCQKECLNCSSFDNCSACQTGYYPLNGICYHDCGEGKFYDEIEKNCKSCSNDCSRCLNDSECSICQEGKFIQEKKCVDTCSSHFFLSGGKDCLECSSECNECEGNADHCLLELDFILQEVKGFLNDFDAVFKVILLKENKIMDPMEFFEGKIFQDVFQISIEGINEEDISKKIALSENNEINLNFELSQKIEEGKKIKIKITGKGDFVKLQSKTYQLKEKSQELDYYYETNPLKFKSILEAQQLAQNRSKTIANSMTYSSASSQLLSVASSFTSLDRSGTMMKFSQSTQMVARLNMLDINFGVILNSFMDGIGNSYNDYEEKSTDNNEGRILENSGLTSKDDLEKGTFGKFTQEGVYLNITRNKILVWKILIYLVSWLFKLCVYFYMMPKIQDEKFLSKWNVKIIEFQRKIHFLIYNFLVIDMIYFGSRSLTHLKVIEEEYNTLLFTAFFYSLITWDTLEIFYTCYKISQENKKKLKIEKIRLKTETEHSIIEEDKDDGEEEKRPEKLLEGKRRKSFSFFKKFAQQKSRKTMKMVQKMKAMRKNKIAESEIKKMKLSDKEAGKMGYKKVQNFEKSFINLQVNNTIREHAVSEMPEEKLEYLSKMSIVTSNFSFVFKITLYHLILTAFSKSPTIAISGMILIELTLILILGLNFCKFSFLPKVLILVSKIVQSLFLLGFLVCCLMIKIYSYGEEKKVSVTLQLVGVYSLILLIIFEYLILFLNCFIMLISFCCSSKKDEGNQKLIVYEWVKTKKASKIKLSQGKTDKMKNKSIVSGREKSTRNKISSLGIRKAAAVKKPRVRLGERVKHEKKDSLLKMFMEGRMKKMKYRSHRKI